MSAETESGTSLGQPRWLLTTRWCIYIDILGFSRFWECDRTKAFISLRSLMSVIHRIGTKVYPEEPERLFVHQMGDGFAIVSDFGETSLERPIAIAIALLRHVATTGTFAAAAIAEGDHSDITGCYPREVTDGSDGKRVRLGAGLMTLLPVMGSAFVRAYGINNAAPPGPFLIVSSAHRKRSPDHLTFREITSRTGESLASIDWVHAESALLSDIQVKAEIGTPSPDELVREIKNYCSLYSSIGDKWGRHLRDLLDIEVKSVRDPSA